MKLFNKLNFLRKEKKKSATALVAHSGTPLIAREFYTDQLNPSFVNFLLNRGSVDLAIFQALSYYKICAPIYISINKLIKEIKNIQPFLKDRVTRDFVDDHEILDFLADPNNRQNYMDFINEFCVFLFITGNNYVITPISRLDKKPLSIFNLQPQNVNSVIGTDGYINRYIYTANNTAITFVRDRNFNYISEDGKFQLYHLKIFNPTNNNNTGLSLLNAVWYEIEMYITGNTHNLSLLERRGNIPGVFSTNTNERLSEEQFMRLKEQIQMYYGNAMNAGKSLLVDGDLKYDQLGGSSNKDMDYIKLRGKIETSIYNIFDIPLPLISPDRMTLSNMDSAKLSLYDNAVLPWASVIFSYLSDILVPKFEGKDSKLNITFNEGTITALEPRRNAKLKVLQSSYILKDNELRQIMGYVPVEEGDAIYKPLNTAPSNEGLDTDEEEDNQSEISDNNLITDESEEDEKE